MQCSRIISNIFWAKCSRRIAEEGLQHHVLCLGKICYQGWLFLWIGRDQLPWPIDQLTNLLSKIKLFPEPIETYWFYPKILWNQCKYYSGLFFYRAAVLEKTLEMTLWAYRGAAVAQRYSQESPGMYLSAVLGRKCRRILRFVQTITIQPNALLRILTKNILLCYYCFMLLS